MSNLRKSYDAYCYIFMPMLHVNFTMLNFGNGHVPVLILGVYIHISVVPPARLDLNQGDGTPTLSYLRVIQV